MKFSRPATDLNGNPVAVGKHYLVQVPPKFSKNYGGFNGVVIPADVVDPINGVVRLAETSDKWIRCNWLKPVNLDPLLSLERSKLTADAISSVVRNLDNKVLASVASSRHDVPPPARRNKLLVASAALAVVGAVLSGYQAFQFFRNKEEANVTASFEIDDARKVKSLPVTFTKLELKTD